jgi:hypothetical protein
MSKLVDAFIAWAKRGNSAQPVVTFEGKDLFWRYCFFRRDEWPDSWWDPVREQYPERPNKLPWWLPLNMFIHEWKPENGIDEDLHDHPRWSITVMLKGRIVERSPWGNRTLSPGSIVFRSRKSIHGFSLDPTYEGEIYTLFIVGRRLFRQSTYEVTAR